tara:strand:+ start:86 stop:328 length:243 start_codon:yes stop_codon:yes gene_type:complete
MKDIEYLLKEAEIGKTSSVSEKITEEAMPFWQGCEERVIAGRNLKPYVVYRLLRDEYGIKTSESAVRNHLLNLVREHGEE